MMSHFFIALLLGGGIVLGRTMIRRQTVGGMLLLVTCAVLLLMLSIWRCSRPAAPLLQTGLNNADLLYQAEGETLGEWVVAHFPDADTVIVLDERQALNPGINALSKHLGRGTTRYLVHLPGSVEDDAGEPEMPEDIQAQIRRQLAGREVAVIAAHHMAAQRVWRTLPNGERPALCFMFVDPIVLPGLFQKRVLAAATVYYATPGEQEAIRQNPHHTPEQARRLIRVLTPEDF